MRTAEGPARNRRRGLVRELALKPGDFRGLDARRPKTCDGAAHEADMSGVDQSLDDGLGESGLMMKSVQVDQRLPRLHQCAEFRLLEVDRRTLGFLDTQESGLTKLD